MGTVRRLAAAAGDVTLGQAVDAYLATLRAAEQAAPAAPAAGSSAGSRREGPTSAKQRLASRPGNGPVRYRLELGPTSWNAHWR
jgi:hypothetical protein